MSADANATVATAAARLKRRAFSLGGARGFDYGIQLLLPMVLARSLDTTAFGQYRFLWLVIGTVMAFATLAMPSSLYYFLPRSDGATGRLYVNQTLIYLAVAGLISALAVGSWNPWLPEALRTLTTHGLVVPLFVLLWVVASLLDSLPSVDERIRLQAKVTIGLATLRAAGVSVVAILTHDLGAVLMVLLAFVAFKSAVLLTYVASHHGLRRPILRWHALGDQLRYAAPFGAGGGLYVLRIQADQWVAATLFSLGMFASFSIAAVLGPLLNVFRQAVSAVFLPSMSRLQANGDIRSALAMNSRANVMVATLVYPVLAFAFFFAEDLVTLVYTAAYVEAAPVMRVYIAGLAALVIELATVTMVLRQGAYILGLNFVALLCSAALSWYAAHRIGLAGAAVGSVAVAYLDRLVTMWRISLLTGVTIGRQQHWRTLGLLLLLAATSAAIARGIVEAGFGDNGALIRIMTGGGILAPVYAAGYVPFRKSCSERV